MNIQTILLLIIVALLSLGLAAFQYIKTTKVYSTRTTIFIILRTLTWFCLGLLLINPKLKHTTFTLEKASLVLAIDNSESIAYLKASEDVKDIVTTITKNEGLQNKFNITSYTLGEQLRPTDSLQFTEKQTNIASAFSQLQNIYKGKIAPTILITDGNQTYGESYEYSANKYKQDVFPVVVGDTTQYKDLSIKQVNANTYVYLNNKFSVEIIANYFGKEPVNTQLEILHNNSIVYTKAIAFTADSKSHIVTATLPVATLGVKTFTVRLRPLSDEKNQVNNSKIFGIEVIDERTNILILTSSIHPDLGALKTAIETNKQRLVTIKKDTDTDIAIEDYQMVILYQPKATALNYFNAIENYGIHTFIITGTQTDYGFLNSMQQNFSREISAQTEDYQARYNANYNTFQVDDIGFGRLPPLKDNFGDIILHKPHNVLLKQTVLGVETEHPLLVTFEDNTKRHAVLFGEDLWKWRSQSYVDNKTFEYFDEFIGKLVQYLSSKQERNRLNVTYNSFYNGGDAIAISAQYFDKNYEFDARASLSINLKGKQLETNQNLPLQLKQNYFEIDLSSLPPDIYNFKISVNGDSITRSGTFEIIEFNVEQQFLSSNVTTLKNLATNTKHNLNTLENASQIIDALLSDEHYKPIQKQQHIKVSLIEWYYLLALLVLCLTLEWFIRKYNGLI